MTDLGRTPVTVLGLGAMGTALARALLAAGHPTTVWNRNPAKAAALVEHGAVAATTPVEAIRASRLIVVCLLDQASVLDVLDGDAVAGRVLVNLTSGTPRQAEELAAWAADHQADHLDGGIMAVPPMIGTPGAFVLYSGSCSAFDTHRPVLEVFGEAAYVGSAPGAASLQDIALLSGMYGQMMGVLHAFAMVRSAGIAATEFEPRLSAWLAAMSRFTTEAARLIDAGEYGGEVVSNLEMQTAAYHHLLEAATEQGVRPDLLAPLLPLMQRRVADGHGAENVAGLVELLTLKENA
ncbi:NAD(P)-dependent oxidoreductase [Pseudonocardia sp. CA-107938]|uniref:NAD(P)-dependent oxidoreductase n=1 Tax=Pseudonocardia sp. CA-107938 TaxID=3240021 RepID=UPI003D8C7E47